MVEAWCLLLVRQGALPKVELSSLGPRRAWTRTIERVGESAASIACFDEGMICWQESNATRIDPKKGRTLWSQAFAFSDPAASTGPPTMLRFGSLLIVCQARQGRDYFSSLTALDSKTGKLRWHKLFETGYFRTEKQGSQLFTYMGASRKEISLHDGSILERSPITSMFVRHRRRH